LRREDLSTSLTLFVVRSSGLT
jgi:hypothetical protein